MIKENEKKWRRYDGKEVMPRKVTEKGFAIHNQSYCVLWNSEELTFKKIIEGTKEHLFVDEAVACPENECEIEKYENKPEKVKNQLRHVFDFELKKHLLEKLLVFHILQPKKQSIICII